MSNLTTRMFAAAFGAVFLLGCAAPATPPPLEPVSHDLTQADLDAVRARWDALIEAQSRADWDAIADMSTDDLIFLDPRTGMLRGKSAWREWVDSMNFGDTDGGVHQIVEVGGSGDMAYVVWTMNSSWTEDGTAITVQGKGLTVMVREADGTWKGARNAWNQTPGAASGG